MMSTIFEDVIQKISRLCHHFEWNDVKKLKCIKAQKKKIPNLSSLSRPKFSIIMIVLGWLKVTTPLQNNGKKVSLNRRTRNTKNFKLFNIDRSINTILLSESTVNFRKIKKFLFSLHILYNTFYLTALLPLKVEIASFKFDGLKIWH